LPQNCHQPAAFFRKKDYGGLVPSEVRKLKQLEEENTRLRKLVADLMICDLKIGPFLARVFRADS
jgi:putative transposase